MGFSTETVALTIPAPEISGFVSDFFGAVSLPAPSASGQMSAPPWVASIRVPAFTVEGPTSLGWVAAISPEPPAVSAAILTGGLISGALSPPAVVMRATIRAEKATAISTPAPSVSGAIYEEVTWDVVVAAVAPSISARWPTTILSGFDTWAVNVKNAGHSTYTNFNFNSFFRLGASYYGCAADGIYILTGDDDAGTAIEAIATFGASNLGTGKKKRMDSAHPSIRADEVGTVSIGFATDGGALYAYTAAVSDDVLEPVRIKPGRGLSGRYWQIELRNASGSRFTTNAIRLIPVPLSRRV